MKIPYSWLSELLDGDAVPIDRAVELLTVSGTAVEGVEHVGIADAAGTGGTSFKVGRVLAFEPHPDADRLRVAKVDTGDADGPRQIVCGASNFAAGDTVAVVVPGGRMPDGMEIREAKLRGVDSHGMMLSERELGLSTEHDGIMLLSGDFTPGEPLNTRVPLGDAVLELEITGNRPDCLGVMGVARELAVAAGVELRTDVLEGDADATAPGDVRDHVTVELRAPDLCPRYMARAFVDVTVGPSPAWMKARLAWAGMRSINNVVDVTNYVMLLTGQPLHAFDAAQVGGKRIVVRRADEGELVTTLDEVERTLDPEMLVIADADRPAVIAGVMGAANVEVSAATTSLVLEAASFDGLSIQRTSRALGLRSESSNRFEKGLDPHTPEVALRLASKLLVELCGAAMVPGTIDEQADGGLATPPTFELPIGLPERILGIEIAPTDAHATLTQLGFDVAYDKESLHVTAPAWRMFDVTRPIDAVEELGRFRLASIPSLLPPVTSGGALLTSVQRLRRQLEDSAAGMGLHEVVTYGLVAPGTAESLGVEEDDAIRLANPMTVDHAELRTNLVPGHLEVARRNIAGGQRDVAIFETGRTFHTAPEGTLGEDGLPRYSAERDVVSVLLTGTLAGARWDLPGLPADVHAAVGTALALVGAAGVDDAITRSMPNPPHWLHPGRSAEIRTAAGATVGWVAQIHPRIAANAGVEQDAFAIHLDIAALDAVRTPVHRYAAFSEFPPVLEDIAVVLDDTVASVDVLASARAAGAPLLESVDVFDRYQGAPVPDGKHSLAIRLTFRAADRTLTDDDVVAVRTAIVERLTADHGAELRG